MKGICPLNKWNDLFGLPGQGAHKYKVFNVIGVDNMMTIAGAIFVTNQYDIPFPISIIGLYVIGILLHMLFGVQTKSLTFLGVRC